jgi:hypothetical protein
MVRGDEETRATHFFSTYGTQQLGRRAKLLASIVPPLFTLTLMLSDSDADGVLTKGDLVGLLEKLPLAEVR